MTPDQLCSSNAADDQPLFDLPAFTIAGCTDAASRRGAVREPARDVAAQRETGGGPGCGLLGQGLEDYTAPVRGETIGTVVFVRSAYP
jgi:hypothetical protein